MKIVVTGGSGFLGRKLTAALCARGTAAGPTGTQTSISEIISIDNAAPLERRDEVRYVEAEISSAGVFEKFVPDDTASIFHLAAVVSAQAESDFDLGMRVNVDATRALLERCRALERPPRLVFTSSAAAFGVAPPVVDDGTPALPLSSYGVEKVIGEYLVGEYSRRGFVDGRVVRLPSVVIRPGRPNKAASSFASSILREPLQGSEVVCPVSDDLAICIKSPRAAVADLIHAHDLPSENWPDGLRVINLPALTVTVAEMVAALERAGGDTSLIIRERDPEIEKIVCSWPQGLTTDRADALGFNADESIDAVVRQFIEDELGQ